MIGPTTSILASQRCAPAPALQRVIPFRELKPHCASCGMRDLCLPAGLGSDEMRQLDQVVSNHVHVKRRDSLFRSGDPFTSLYAIRLGTFKSLLLTQDGREQVMGYHMGGEIVGIDAIGNHHHAGDVIALEDSEVCVLPFAKLDRLAREVPSLHNNLLRFISRNVCHGHEMMLLLGSLRAEERLAVFLLDLADRYRTRGYSSREFVLRMSREEIASYLGMKLETVSRLFSHLQAEGLLQVQGRTIKLLDSSGLGRLIGQRC
jgi:CRP/FNR family transcriptional regulator, anaerobic regulatory protein